jgi:RNA polymerase sigma-70 factor (ECF subfamily)
LIVRLRIGGNFSILELCMQLGPDHGQPQLGLDFGEYLDGLYGYALVVSRNTTEAQDLVQETCLRALRAMGGLRADESLKRWLFTILRNIWLNELRQRRTTGDLIELDADGAYEPADAAQDPHSWYVDSIEREQVRAAIRQLPLDFREIIMLREYDELSYQEIAALLDRPRGTVMSRLARARARLRELLSDGHMTPTGRIGQQDEWDSGVSTGLDSRQNHPVTIEPRCGNILPPRVSSL